MASLNEHSFERKLQGVQNTQDSIQTLSLWCVHHKAHHKRIVQLWMKVLKKSKATHRLNLFYLCNDVVQQSRRKGANVFIDSFALVMEEAATLAREPSIRSNILRIFNIWEERGVFDSDFIEKIKADVVSSKVRIKASTKFLAEFKPHRVTEGIEKFTRLENDVELKQKQLQSSKVDVTDTEALRQLKDRNDGKRFSQQFEEGANKLEDFIKHQEKEIEERTKLVVLLEQSEIFYEAQYSEAKIVANAYRNFGTRVSSLKKRLDELKKFLPDPSSPIPSPTMDAPSPGATPPTPPYDPSQDNVGVEDMDMSDSDDEKPSGTIIAAAPMKSGTGASKTGTRPVTSRKQKGDATKPIPPPPGLGQIPGTGMMFSSFMSGGLPSNILSTTASKTSSSSKPATSTATATSTASTKTTSSAGGKGRNAAYSPSSSFSPPSPDNLNLSPAVTKSSAVTSAGKRSLTTAASTKPIKERAAKMPKYDSPVTQTFGRGSGGLDLDSRLRQVMQNTPIFPQAVPKELYDSPGRSARSPNISTPPRQKSAIHSQSWGNSPVSQSSLTAAQQDQQQSAGEMTPSQILGLVQANTQPAAKIGAAGGISELSKDTESGTPLRDEEGTPVRDENNKATAQAAAANPIEFLSRLITTTQQAQGGTGANFLSGLSALTETMKSAMQQRKKPSVADATMEIAAALQSGAVASAVPNMPAALQKIPVAGAARSSAGVSEEVHKANQTVPSVQQEGRPGSLATHSAAGPTVPATAQGLTRPLPISPVQQSAPVLSPSGPISSIGGNLPPATEAQALPIAPVDQGGNYSVGGGSEIEQRGAHAEQPGVGDGWNGVSQAVSASEPTSPIPVLGDQGKNSIPVIGQGGQASFDVNQVGSVPSSLNVVSAGGATAPAAEVLGNPIPSYSQRALQPVTSVYASKGPQVSPGLHEDRPLNDDFGRGVAKTRPVEVHEYGFGRPIERLHSSGVGQTIGVLRRERELAARAYERDEYARMYSRPYDRTRDHDLDYPRSGYRGSTIGAVDNRLDSYPPRRMESRYAGRDPYGYEYSRGGPPGRPPPPPPWAADRRPYRY